MYGHDGIEMCAANDDDKCPQRAPRNGLVGVAHHVAVEVVGSSIVLLHATQVGTDFDLHFRRLLALAPLPG